jgi:hypothetical protein
MIYHTIYTILSAAPAATCRTHRPRSGAAVHPGPCPAAHLPGQSAMDHAAARSGPPTWLTPKRECAHRRNSRGQHWRYPGRVASPGCPVVHVPHPGTAPRRPRIRPGILSIRATTVATYVQNSPISSGRPVPRGHPVDPSGARRGVSRVAHAFLVYMLSPDPGAAAGRMVLLGNPTLSAPERVIGSACASPPASLLARGRSR